MDMLDPPVLTGKYRKDDEPVHMTLDRADVEFEACQKVISKYHEKWVAEKFFLDGMVRDAALNKTGLPNGHWEAEHKARIAYETAVATCQAIIESRR